MNDEKLQFLLSYVLTAVIMLAFTFFIIIPFIPWLTKLFLSLLSMIPETIGTDPVNVAIPSTIMSPSSIWFYVILFSVPLVILPVIGGSAPAMDAVTTIIIIILMAIFGVILFLVFHFIFHIGNQIIGFMGLVFMVNMIFYVISMAFEDSTPGNNSIAFFWINLITVIVCIVLFIFLRSIFTLELIYFGASLFWIAGVGKIFFFTIYALLDDIDIKYTRNIMFFTVILGAGIGVPYTVCLLLNDYGYNTGSVGPFSLGFSWLFFLIVGSAVVSPMIAKVLVDKHTYSLVSTEEKVKNQIQYLLDKEWTHSASEFLKFAKEKNNKLKAEFIREMERLIAKKEREINKREEKRRKKEEERNKRMRELERQEQVSSLKKKSKSCYPCLPSLCAPCTPYKSGQACAPVVGPCNPTRECEPTGNRCAPPCPPPCQP
ncbi:MAG: hypothetical protein ACTSRA_16705 [Promethearchaeota archaeon]